MGDETDSTDNDLRHRLAALEDEVQSLRNDGPKVGRRLLMKGGVATLGLTALATPTSAGDQQAGTIGTEQNPQDVYSEDLYVYEQGSTPSAPPSGYIDIYAKTDGNFYKLQSDGTESQLGGGGLSAGEDFDGQGTSDFTNLASVSTDRVSIEQSVTMYVRADGDDSNDGLSAANAKATIEDAISDAPETPQSESVVIDLGSDTITPPGGMTFYDLSVPLRIVGETDGSGNPAAVLDCTNVSGNLLGVREAKVEFEGVQFTDQPDRFIFADAGSNVSLQNCTATQTSAVDSFLIGNNGKLSFDGDCYLEFDSDASTADQILNFEGGSLATGGTIEVTGTGSPRQVITSFDGAGRIDQRADVLGNGNVTRLFDARGHVHWKVADATYNGASYLVMLGSYAEFIAQDGLSNVTVSNRNLQDIKGGSYADGFSGPRFAGVPVAGTNPDGVEGNVIAPMWYDVTTATLLTRMHDDQRNLPLGVRQRDGATASDLLSGEAAFDGANSRMLYKDYSGTVHYWNTDGTL